MSEIFLEVNGKRYRGWKSLSYSKSIESMVGSFSLEASVKEDAGRIVQNDLKLQDKVSVLIDDNKIISGFIDTLTINESVDNHSISVSGYDKTIDIVDSSISEMKEYKHRDFIKLVENVLVDNGFSDIKVINKTGESLIMPEQAKGAPVQPDIEETIVDFLNRYATKVQVLLITDQDGNILVTRESSTLSEGRLVSQAGNLQSNIISKNLQLSTRDRFARITYVSQDSNISQTESSVNQEGQALDKQIRDTRRRVILSRTPTQAGTLDNLAKWSVALRQAKGLRYTCVVQDFYANKKKNELWKPNTLIQVIDDSAQLQGQFLIQGVEFSRSVSEGSLTRLSIVNKGSFAIDSLIAFNNNFAQNLQ